MNELERVIEKTEQVPRHTEIFGGMTMGLLRDLSHELKGQETAYTLLRHSWKDIDFKYEGLTPTERSLLTREEFTSLLKKVVPVGTEVTSRCQVTEGGHGFEGDPTAEFMEDDRRPNPHYVHAESGEPGWVEHHTEDGLPQIRFRRTRTATLVDWADIEVA